MTINCPICSSMLTSMEANPNGGDFTKFVCPRCGSFTLTGSFLASLPHLLTLHPDASAKLSHAIRRTQDDEKSPLLNAITAEAVIRQPLPRPQEQADLFIRWLARNVPGPGETLWVEFSSHGSIIGCKSAAGFELVLDHLFLTGLITGTQAKTIGGGDRAYVTLSFMGWNHFERLNLGTKIYRKGFMAMKFGDEKLNTILESVLKPSAKRAGFDLQKLDDIPKAGLIDDRLRVEIQSSDFLVADLTHDNLGAYWEAGYAEGLGKPVIYTCEKDKFKTAKTHFDTNHHLTILWDANDPKLAGIQLTATIRATLPHIALLVDDGI